MLIAPHPDDEALACSVILQRATRAGAAIRVVYATDGDDNPWPQRILERKWRLNEADRKRWGNLRRAEALAALRVLNVHASATRFLGLPDQGLTKLLITDCRTAVERLTTSITDWAPTHLLIPSAHDTHPDHNALAVMLRLLLAKLHSSAPAMSVWTYSVHGQSNAFFGRAQKLQQSDPETAIKEQAIRCHKTQLKLSRRRFLAYATRSEYFLQLGLGESSVADGPIRSISRQADVLGVRLALSTKLMRATYAALLILGHDVMERVRCVRMQVPGQDSAVEVLDCQTRERLYLAQYHGDAFKGHFSIPLDIFSPAHALFVKLERRSWFFDEAGWLETPPAVIDTQLPKIATATPVSAHTVH